MNSVQSIEDEVHPGSETALAVGVVTESADVGDQGAALAVAGSKPAHPQPQSIEGLIALAIQHGAAVEPLERLMAMRQTLKAEAAREAFFEALSAFQSECPIIGKAKTATIETKTGGRYTYRYAPLDVIVQTTSPIMRKYGLSFRFDTRFEADPPAQIVVCTVHHREGHQESSEFRTPVDANARMNDMQKSASAQTYAKRYAFCNAFGILTGDDDDDGASGGSPRVAPGPNVIAPRPAPPTSSPRSVGKNLVPLKRVSRAQDSDGSEAGLATTSVAATPASTKRLEELVKDSEAIHGDLRQQALERAAMVERAERISRGQDVPDDDVILPLALDRCNGYLTKLYGKTLDDATISELQALGRVIDRQMRKLEES